MDKVYNHKEVEEKWYSFWEKSEFFTPKIDKKKKPFSIIMPPPNANGELHIGHATFVALEDLLTRYHRMKGNPTLWLPGADHAGIATQVVYERELAKKGKTKFDIGRKEFFKQTYQFSMKNKKNMENQLKKLGASCDWSRMKFTLDPDVSKIVYQTFKNLYDDGLIYRGERIINWCSRCATALSDLEVERQEIQGKLWFIKYPIKSLPTKQQIPNFITVATTRPETMLGDTAVAVNPYDKRYQKLIGQTVILPLVEREIPIIADRAVETEFGSGAVKVTPAHDPLDFEIAKRHHLSLIQVIGFDGKMTKNAGPYAELEVKRAREKILQDLAKKNLLEQVTNHNLALSKCERCSSVIEPLLSKQWFIKVNEKILNRKSRLYGQSLAGAAIEVVKKGRIKIIPKRFEKNYFNWMKNIHDWCISRQLWWGHRLPVWYCATDTKTPQPTGRKVQSCGEIIISETKPKKCPRCGGKKLVQDEDTLDTWFSSAQWPFSTLMASRNADDFEYFYPTSVMETGYDILFFWVARMIMMGLYATGQVPFKTVFLHGLVRDERGQKMSKSKGNVIDPLEMIEQYGADAVRISLIFGTSPGQDLNLGEGKIRGMRNFTNKIWNAARFVLSNLDGYKEIKNLDPQDHWEESIIKLKNALIEKTTEDLEHFRFNLAIERLHNLFWHQFCDKILEKSKTRLAKDSQNQSRTQNLLLSFLKTYLLLLHPFMPFITEEIWQRLKRKGVLGKKSSQTSSIMISSWPKSC